MVFDNPPAELGPLHAEDRPRLGHNSSRTTSQPSGQKLRPCRGRDNFVIPVLPPLPPAANAMATGPNTGSGLPGPKARDLWARHWPVGASLGPEAGPGPACKIKEGVCTTQKKCLAGIRTGIVPQWGGRNAAKCSKSC